MLQLDVDRCTICGACATACPTKALELSEDQQSNALVHDPTACNGCGVCVGACPEQALGVRLLGDGDQARTGHVTLVSAPVETCTGCGSPLPPLALRLRVAGILGLVNGRDDLCATCARVTQPR